MTNEERQTNALMITFLWAASRFQLCKLWSWRRPFPNQTIKLHINQENIIKIQISNSNLLFLQIWITYSLQMLYFLISKLLINMYLMINWNKIHDVNRKAQMKCYFVLFDCKVSVYTLESHTSVWTMHSLIHRQINPL